MKTKVEVKLDPMNSYERKVVHEALQKFKNIITESEGEEPNRCVVIKYCENNEENEEYEASRGFVFSPIKDWLPGQEIYSFEDFLRYVDEVSKDEDSASNKRRRLMNQLVQFRDGNNCKRVVEWLKL